MCMYNYTYTCMYIHKIMFQGREGGREGECEGVTEEVEDQLLTLH